MSKTQHQFTHDVRTQPEQFGKEWSVHHPFRFWSSLVHKFKWKKEHRIPKSAAVSSPMELSRERLGNQRFPSPVDFVHDKATPIEKVADLEQLQEALLPSPLDFEYHNTKRDTIIADEIASLCKDFMYSQKFAHSVDGTPIYHHRRSLLSKEYNRHHPSSNTDRIRPPPPFQVETSEVAKYDAHMMHDHNGNSGPCLATPHGGKLTDSRFRSPPDECIPVQYTILPSPQKEQQTLTVASPVKKSSKTKYQRRSCSVEGCANLSRSKGLCKAHGGGKRCSVASCTRASQSGSLCISHGGGKRCVVEGCQRAAQSRGMCKAHGGGVRCKVDGCAKSSQGEGYCRTHGGGKRCSIAACSKWAQRGGKCTHHCHEEKLKQERQLELEPAMRCTQPIVCVTKLGNYSV